MEGFGIESHEKLPAFEDLVIYTATLYKNDEASRVRQELALKLLENIEKLNIRCVVIDGGSNEDFIAKVRSYKNVELRIDPTLTMGESRREALRIAIKESSDSTSDHFFLWVEPEKSDLISVENLAKMIKPLREDITDIVVPARKDMETLPHFQAWIEQRANKRVHELTKETSEEVWDLWFGPRMFNKEGSKYFLDYKSSIDKWDSVMVPVINAFNDGKRVTSVPVDFTYDDSQKINEEKDPAFIEKRIEQYKTILTEMGDPFWKHKGEDAEPKEN